MKHLLYLLVLVSSISYAQVYQPVTCHFNGYPTNGVKIKTNIPFTPSSHMPTIIIEGYNYGTGDAIGIMVNYYLFSATPADTATYYFVKHNATSYGGYTPVIKLAKENNKIVIYIDSKDYFIRFMVRAFSKGLAEQASWFEGWTVVDEALPVPAVLAHQVTVPYRNRFKNEVYLDGTFSVGTAATSANIGITRPLSSANSTSISNYPTIKKGATGITYYNSIASTEADTFNLSSLTHYGVNQGTLGAGSTITSQYGFFANSNLVGATNNYGFFGNINAGNGRWNFFAAGTANNYMGGSLGIGSTTLTQYNLRVSKNITGAATSYGMFISGDVQSDVTSSAIYNRTTASTQASGFTLPTLYHYIATQGTFGAGSTVSHQYGFQANSTLIGATNNYGFFGDIAAGTGRWNLYMGGTANNYLGGNTGIGVTVPNSRMHVLENTANTNSTNGLTIEQSSTGDASLHLLLTGVQRYTMGIDNSDGDKLKIGTNADLSTNNLLTLTNAGQMGLGTSSPYSRFQTSATSGQAEMTPGSPAGVGLTVSNNNNAYGLNMGVHTNGTSWIQAARLDGTATVYNLTLQSAGGNVGIGTTNIPTDYKLAVGGNIIAEKIKVKKRVGGVWPDYVFSPHYKLPRLEEIEEFTKKNSHLPEIPSANEIERDGQDLGEMNRLLLKKVEEITLYLIDLKKQNDKLNTLIESQSKKIAQQDFEIEKLKHSKK